MSYFVCPNCQHEADIFGHGGGERMAAELERAVPRPHADLSADSRGRRHRRAARRQRAGLAGGAGVHGGGRADGGAGVDRELQAADDSARPSGADEHRRSASTRSPTASTCSLHEDHACPIVAVNLWYHVGSKNETPGPHGLRASVRAPDVRRIGAPRHGLLPAAAGGGRVAQRIDQCRSHQLLGGRADQRARARAVDGIGSHGLSAAGADRGEVREPARRRAERAAAELREPAYGLAPMAMLGGALSAGSSVSLDDDRRDRRPARGAARRRARVLPHATTTRRTRRSRSPATSIRTRALDAGARVLRARSPPGRAVAPVRAAAPRSTARRRLLLEDRVELPRLYLAWLSPAMFADGDAELDLAADLLANGKTSRLYRRLVFDERIATDVSASQNSREIGGFLQVAATAAPGHTLAELERVDRRGDRAARGRGPDRRRDRARPRAGRGAVRLPAADGRRLRRQVRSAERLQRRSSAIPATSIAISRATSA